MAIEHSIRGVIQNFEKLGSKEVCSRLEKIFTDTYKQYTEDYNQNVRESIRKQYQNKLDQEIEQIKREKEEQLKQFPAFAAAEHAIEQAIEAAEMKGLDNYTRTQLVRTIGVIWSAALGAKIIGAEDPGMQNQKQD